MSIANSLRIDTSLGITAQTGQNRSIALQEIPTEALHSRRISERTPIVARYTQGHVLGLLKEAAATNASGVLIVEGRKTTLSYANASLNIELIVDRTGELGARRVAQRIGMLISRYTNSDSDEVVEFLRRYYR